MGEQVSTDKYPETYAPGQTPSLGQQPHRTVPPPEQVPPPGIAMQVTVFTADQHHYTPINQSIDQSGSLRWPK